MAVLSDDLLLTLEAARTAFAAGEMERAEALCASILEKDKDNGAALHLRGALALHHGHAEDALKWLEKAASVAGRDASLLCNFGETYRRLGRLDEAREHLEQALQKDNTNPAPHFNLAMTYRLGGEPRLAEHFFRNVLMLDPQMARARYELAELYRSEGHVAEAEREYRAALDALPLGDAISTDPAASRRSKWSASLGSLLRERGDTQGALEILRGAVSTDPKNATAHLELAKCMFELCRETEAESHYRIARSKCPPLGDSSAKYVSAKVTRIKGWCERNGARYSVLARAQWLAVPDLKTIPAAAQSGFRLGKPVTSELFVACIPRARVLPGQFAVLSEDSCLFTDGVVNWAQYYPQSGQCVQHATDDLRIMLDIPGTQADIDGVCAVLGGSGDHFTWMFEALARLWALEQHPGFQDICVVVPGKLSEGRMGMLQAAGVPLHRIIQLAPDRSLQSRELIVPSIMTVGDWVSPIALQYLRRKFSQARSGRARRLFLSRSSAPHSRLINEPELMPILESHGFESIDCIATSPLDLLAALVDAELVIASDDETLASLVVVPQGAKIGAIIPEGVYRARAFFVCSQLGHDLTYLVAQPDFASNELHSQCNVELLPKVLEDFLERAWVDK